MKKISIILFLALISSFMFSACQKQKSPTESTATNQAEQARQDSIAQAQAEAQAKAAAAKMEHPSAENTQAKQDSVKKAAAADSTRMAMNKPQFVSNGHFAIQVGSWRSETVANKSLKTWKDRGFDHAYIKKYGVDSTGNVWFRVRLGLMGTREQANNEVQDINSKYHTNAWVSKVTF